MSTFPPPLDCEALLPLAERKRLSRLLSQPFSDFTAAHRLPEDAADHLFDHYLSIAAWLATQRHELARPIVFGINGSQGSGKSTLSKALALLMPLAFDLSVAEFSLDDVYLSHADRAQLARDVHPLLQTRGVPGTHEVELGMQLIRNLLEAKADTTVAIPRFDKQADDRLPPSQWHQHKGTADIVIFEGWCVATPPQDDSDLSESVNELERTQDPDGVWRRFANDHLKTDYADWFTMIDCLLFLKAPSFEVVLDWRWKQEQKTLAAHPEKAKSPGALNSREKVAGFIANYERLTRHTLAHLDEQADVMVPLGVDHRYQGLFDLSKGRS